MRRACADCEQALGILNRADAEVTHGQCKRHFIRTLLQAGKPWKDVREGIASVGPEGFCEDLLGQAAQ